MWFSFGELKMGEYSIKMVYLNEDSKRMIDEIRDNNDFFKEISFSAFMRYIIKYYYDREIVIINRGEGGKKQKNGNKGKNN